MKLIFGLGNPGLEYVNTRHNVGRMVITKLVDRLNLKLSAAPKFSSKIARTNDTLIGISTDFMNLSGNSLAGLVNFYKLNPPDIYIIHDDLDLPVGESRIQFDRGAAGHNGVKSVIDRLGTQEFNRVRIGIGHPRDSQISAMPVEDYVLKPFSSGERVIIDQTIDKISGELITLIQN